MFLQPQQANHSLRLVEATQPRSEKFKIAHYQIEHANNCAKHCTGNSRPAGSLHRCGSLTARMNASEPLPRSEDKRPIKSARRRIIIRAAVVVGAVLIALRLLGLVHPFSVNGASMTPTLSLGDKFIMEGFTFLLRKPQRGDIIVLKTGGIKRVAGLPGDRLRIADGKLYVNDKHISLKNQAGEIHYLPVTGARYLTSSADILTVPDGHYFVLGDNSADSVDSRTWGCIPARNILGRAAFRYWPPARIGGVR